MKKWLTILTLIVIKASAQDEDDIDDYGEEDEVMQEVEPVVT
jgi:hypothetical protein